MSDLRTLIEAAKTDAPSAAARANVWAGVSTVVGEAAAASGGGSAAAGSAGAAKMLILGTLLGGSVTIGLGAAALLIGRAPEARPTVSVAAPAAAETTEAAEATKATSLWTPAPSPAPLRVRAAAPDSRPDPSRVVTEPGATQVARVAGFEAGKRAAARAHAIAPVSAAVVVAGPEATMESDTLAREASSLAEARAALARSDALSALQIVRGLRALPGRQLVPEELAVEAQALRGLGLDDDANVVEAHLRVRFPDSVLGRERQAQ